MESPAKTERNALILSAYKEGKGYSEIARIYNVSRQRVYGIIRSSTQGGRNWDNLSTAIKQRDEYECQWKDACSDIWSPKRADLIVHHIDFDPSNNDPSNLITLCSFCHKKFHSLEKSDAAYKRAEEDLKRWKRGIDSLGIK